MHISAIDYNVLLVEGETLGLLEAFTWMTDLSLTHVILKSDSKIVIDKINNFAANVTDIRYNCWV